MSELFVVSCPDLGSVTDAALTRFVDVLTTIQAPGGGVHGDGIARVVLTGGTAGIDFCRKLGELSAREDCPIDWSRLYIYFGDERAVPVDDSDSNEGQARAVFLRHTPIPEEHIYGFRLGELSLPEAVERYTTILANTAPQGFDIHLLGMGGEGHINSLFPHTAATRNDSVPVTIEMNSPKPPAQRVTLTLAAVRAAARVWLLVSGSDKADAVAALLGGANSDDLPVAGATGRNETILFTDQA